jgi:hypothetical protein
MAWPDGTETGRHVHTEHLPADMQLALAEYDQAWSRGDYGTGKFAEGPGAAVADAELSGLVSAHIPTEA